jgi:imidazolonepropionase-like amidohydrolase
MLLHSIVLGASALLGAPNDGQATPSLFALRVGTAETISHGTIHNAVILIEDGRIVMVGEDLPIESGIPVFDHPDAVVMPGIVGCRSRMGLDARAGTELNPELSAAFEFQPGSGDIAAALEAGVTTLGLYPAGGGVPGVGLAIRTKGRNLDDMRLVEPTYLTMYIASNEGAKKLVAKGFELVDKYMEQVAKEREKFDKDVEKEKDKKKQEEMVFVPPVPDEKTLPFVRLVTGDLRAVIGIRKAADYLHLMDVLGERTFDWDVQVTLQDDGDVFYVADRLGKAGRRVICNPNITLHPGTRRERNLPKEFAAVGCKLAFTPISDSPQGYENLRADLANVVAYGLDRQLALRAVTLEPAHVLGLGGRLGSLEAGKDANLLVFDGDPLEPGTELVGVMLEGDFVAGDLAE